MVAKAPTPAQLEAAEKYALGQMCLSIPAKYGNNGYTKWDATAQRCLVTPHGCQPGPTNMLSQYPVDSAGNVIDFSKQKSSRYYDVWKYAPADLLVQKNTSTSRGRPVCSRGNPLVYQWCKFPKQRGQGQEVPGLTNIVPFEYAIQNGSETCNIPKSYCDTHAYNWNQQKLICEKPVGLEVAGFFGVEGLAQALEVRGFAGSAISQF